ncbi:MAG: hypothetical protein GX122_02685 [Candidatus Cloacimonetes bacterium]|nr:hypothetical protein [Candidatus Cloacimonadota bacterium]
MPDLMNTIGIWLAAFFTFCIFSFLYRDNPFYKLAEQIFVGLSAGYGLIYVVYSTMVPNLFAKLSQDFSGNLILLIPFALGLMMLTRIYPKTQWISRYPISIVIGTSAAISVMRSLKTDLLLQVGATIINPFQGSTASEISGNLLVIIGTLCGVYFFYFSKKQEGLAKIPSKIGVYFLMVSFGATFGYTVMARISLLIGRLEFLRKDWLHIIN